MYPRCSLAVALCALAVLPAQACDIVLNAKPSWEQMIGEADVVFVGRAIAMRPGGELDWKDVMLFEVEVPIKGDVGSQFEVAEGMNSCTRSFSIGHRYIFAGMTTVLEDGTSFTWASDMGWDPTVGLSDPEAAEQLSQLEYLNTISEFPNSH